MKRGIEILISWLIIAVLVDGLIVPRGIPRNGFEILFDRLTVASFPFAAWLYARHSNRVLPVICYGLIAGTFSAFVALSFFYDTRGIAKDITFGRQLVFIGLPVLMAFLCVGIFALRRFLDSKS